MTLLYTRNTTLVNYLYFYKIKKKMDDRAHITMSVT